VNATYVCEKGSSHATVHQYEEELARRWWALPHNMYLPLSNGESCQLLYAGRPGGAPGPDIRDAVLRFTSRCSAISFSGVSGQQAKNTVGDVEIHIRATDWFAHKHHTDVRYNNVMLHIVLICDDSRPTLRQDGISIPTCSLNDLPSTTHAHQPTQWPCHHVIAQMNEEERAHLFTLAGTLRFELKTQAFFEPLHVAQSSHIFSVYDVCLIPALAEGLGYGRDRAFFHAAGLQLIGAVKSIPEPLGRAPQPSPLDANRLHILRKLVERWRTTGAWETFRQALLATAMESITTVSQLARLQKLRNIFEGLSTTRTDILICNIVLPFAAAVAQQENDTILAEHARNLYLTYPGLPSNQITRAMCKQLLLKSEPKGACQQQGLHFIYAETCREKRCTDCLIGKQDVRL